MPNIFVNHDVSISFAIIHPNSWISKKLFNILLDTILYGVVFEFGTPMMNTFAPFIRGFCSLLQNENLLWQYNWDLSFDTSHEYIRWKNVHIPRFECMGKTFQIDDGQNVLRGYSIVVCIEKHLKNRFNPICHIDATVPN